LCFQDEFHGITQGSLASGVRGRVVGLLLHFGASVLDRNGETAGAHGREIDHIIAYEGSFLGPDTFFSSDLFEGSALVLNTLADVFELQIAGAKRNRFRDPLGDETGLDSSQPCQRNGGPVVGVKAFGLDQRLAVKAESSFATVVCGLLEHALLSSCRSREDEELAVGEDTVDVEEKEFDFAGSGLSGQFLRHRRNFSSQMPGPWRSFQSCNELHLKFTIGYSVCAAGVRGTARPLEGLMIARKVYVRVKPNALKTFADLLEAEISPWLRSQAGFLDLITLAAPDASEVQVLSFWDHAGSGEADQGSPYPDEMLRKLETVLDGISHPRTFDIVSSTIERFAPQRREKVGDEDRLASVNSGVYVSVPADTDPNWQEPFLR